MECYECKSYIVNVFTIVLNIRFRFKRHSIKDMDETLYFCCCINWMNVFAMSSNQSDEWMITRGTFERTDSRYLHILFLVVDSQLTDIVLMHDSGRGPYSNWYAFDVFFKCSSARDKLLQLEQFYWTLSW